MPRLGPVAVPLLLAAFLTAAAAAQPRAAGGRIVFAADRAPTLYAEIYRVDLGGRRVDLSRSPARDFSPAVSPDGRLVAFASARGGRLALYTVRIDGTHLRRVSPFLAPGADAITEPDAVSWSRDGTRLLARVPAAGRTVLWSGRASGGSRGRVLARGDLRAAAWGPGAELAWLDGADVLHVVSAAGRRLWQGVATSFAWSAGGRLAATAPGPEVLVRDAAGRRLATLAAGAFAWSPDGKELATLSGAGLRRLEVRAGGTGRPLVSARVAARNGSLQWLGNARLRISTGSGWVGYDVLHRRAWKLPGALARPAFPNAVSRAGAVAVAGSGERTPTLAVATPAGRLGRTLATAPACGSDTPFLSLQFTPDGRSLVYQDDCFAPSADLYSIAADGSGLGRLTSTATDETAPAVSPDGARIAYAEVDAGTCKGCPQTLWEMDAAGGGRHALTTAGSSASLWFDAEPCFSPDGATLVFSHSTGDTIDLVELPAAGGARHPLSIAGSGPAWGPARLAFVDARQGVETVLPDGSQPSVVVASDPGLVGGSLAWSRGGRLAWLDAHAGGRLSLAVWSGAGVVRKPLGPLRRAFRGSGLAWSPDGTRLAFTACDASDVCDLWTAAADGTGLRRLTHGLGAIGRLAWTG